MLDIICTRKEKTRVILFFEIYKTVLIIFKSENPQKKKIIERRQKERTGGVQLMMARNRRSSFLVGIEDALLLPADISHRRWSGAKKKSGRTTSRTPTNR